MTHNIYNRLISKTFQVLEQTQFCDTQSDRQMGALGKTICLTTLMRGNTKRTKFKLQYSDKNNLSITSKSHAHLQTLTKIPAKFQKDTAKFQKDTAKFQKDTAEIVGGVHRSR